MTNALDEAAKESYSASSRNPFLNKVTDTPRGAYHGKIKTAILKNGEAEPDKLFGIIEVEFPNGQVRVSLDQINRSGHAGKYARGRFKAALLGAMGEQDPGEGEAYKTFLKRVLTDQDGEILGKPVTIIATAAKDQRFNALEWMPGHRPDVETQEMPVRGAAPAPASPAEDTPPPVPEEPKADESPEDKAKAAGYIRNGDTDWFYHPQTRDQKKLSAFA